MLLYPSPSFKQCFEITAITMVEEEIKVVLRLSDIEELHNIRGVDLLQNSNFVS